ncbi:haloacid dehalogenase [Williamsoniiplasma somnilux]|uniref:Haloacid dehalogenase n=1 Tax=Williamsoniiplasma somnilux TaxID=215578 RepID=A0A2K8NZH7_9MOLU|nr:Cof-type HAD-IIB family hydrolase [Williamsoniiplasma somnilux]ATZ18956.1 haloacid dehalogenase [Williamsoniiplasma somnilux]
MDIKLIALDMDGTVYYRMGEIVPSNIPPLHAAIAQGIDVAIVTGRPVLAPPNKLKKHGLVSDKTVIVGYNGGCIYHVEKEEVIHSNPIDSEMAKKVFELIEKPEYSQTIFWGYVDDLKQSVLAHNFKSEDEIIIPVYKAEKTFFEGKYLYFKDIKDNFNFKFFKILAFNLQPGLVEELKKIGLEFSISSQAIEINAPGINKKFAVEWLSKNWNVSVENIMAIGDGSNDLPMIEYAGVGVAMKNSIQEIKDIAQIYIDLTNEEGAVGEVINQYVLKK